MRTYEARFFPYHLDGKVFVVVGHVVWDSKRSNGLHQILPSPTLSEVNAPAALLATLRHLVLRAGSKSPERLVPAKNRFWSFVEIEPDNLASEVGNASSATPS